MAEPSPPALDLPGLLREYLLAGHLIDRAGMPGVIVELGREVMLEVAIDEWMGASPIYTRRIHEVLGLREPTVENLCKGMQFDIGAPPEFLDFRYKIIDDDHGEFWLDHCGALMDVEPMGERYVVGMCHTIEDPTFDATAAAVNPRARIRPIHRPPRAPADRQPHCHWTIAIEDDAEPLPLPAPAVELARSHLAQVPVPVAPEGYEGPVDSDLDLSRLAPETLEVLLGEIALQGHLLGRSFMLAVERRTDTETARRLGTAQLVGSAGVTARRLRRFLAAPPSAAGIARVLQLHPLFGAPQVARIEVELTDDEVGVRIDAQREDDGLSWGDELTDDAGPVLQAIAREVALTGVVEPAASGWRIRLDGAPSSEPVEVALAAVSTGADFVFTRVQLRLRTSST